MSEGQSRVCRMPTEEEVLALTRDFPHLVRLKGCHGGEANRRKTHCKNGHPLSGANLYVPPGHPTWRQCRECKRVGARRSKARRTRSTGIGGAS